MIRYEVVFINKHIIQHLNDLENEMSGHQSLPWDSMEDAVYRCMKGGSDYMTMLHTLMLPYYKKYFFADPVLFPAKGSRIYYFLRYIIENDIDFGKWIADIDLIAATEAWGDFYKRSGNDNLSHYNNLLELLIMVRSYIDWHQLSDRLEALLFTSEEYSDHKTDELLCILHGFSMVMRQKWHEEKTRQHIELLNNHWGFLKYYYSLMIRHIVGTRLTNWAAVTNAIMQSNDNYPHLHIYYCALVERMDSFKLDFKKYKKLDDAKVKLFSVINRVEPSELLYELCNAIFPAEFQYMLNTHRPKSYGELQTEIDHKNDLIHNLQHAAEQTNKQIENLTAALKAAVEASIPVEDIERELSKFPPNMAWGIFNTLNELLGAHDVWHNYYPSIREALLNRLNEYSQAPMNTANSMKEMAARPFYSTLVNYETGSVHDDKRSQLIVGSGENLQPTLNILQNE